MKTLKLSEELDKFFDAIIRNRDPEGVANDMDYYVDKVMMLEETIDKLKSCLNCTHCYNTEVYVYCNKSKQYLVDFSPCCEWEISND